MRYSVFLAGLPAGVGLVVAATGRAACIGPLCWQLETNAEQTGDGLPFHSLDGPVVVGLVASRYPGGGLCQRGEHSPVAAIYRRASRRQSYHQFAERPRNRLAGLRRLPQSHARRRATVRRTQDHRAL